MLHGALRFARTAALPLAVTTGAFLSPMWGPLQAESSPRGGRGSACRVLPRLSAAFCAGAIPQIQASRFKENVTESSDDVFVEIYSQTCRACSALAPRLNSLALLLPKLPVSPAGIQSKILKMDIDDEEGLPEPVYGVSLNS